jgi:hypothetical protein
MKQIIHALALRRRPADWQDNMFSFSLTDRLNSLKQFCETGIGTPFVPRTRKERR